MADNDVLTSPAPNLSRETVAAALQQFWGLTVTDLVWLGSERDVNVLLDNCWVLKVSNPAEQAETVDLEISAMNHVADLEPTLPIPRHRAALDGALQVLLVDDAGRVCRARVITVVPGEMLEGRTIDLSLAEQTGATAARLSLALQGFFHPAAGREFGWDIRRLRTVVGDSQHWAALLDRVEPALTSTTALPSWVQHADVTLTNLLVTDGVITGVIDFGDLHHTAAVCDLAATVTSVLRNTAPEQPCELWSLLGAVIKGYQSCRLLSPDEVAVLGELIIARLVLTAAVSARRVVTHADNRDYISRYDAANQRALDALAEFTPEQLRARLHRLAGTADVAAGAGELLARRRAAMGGKLSPLFYREPLEIVRGQGPWLFAQDGTRYLDAYNNVAVVGHAHPTVTQAVSRQLGRLNTHSRYLHHGIVELAERLLATMPTEIDTCLFTTSGTEANELAWRLATAATGGTGAIIAEHAYHGSSKWFADLSSNEWPVGYRPRHVETFEAPRNLDPAAATALVAAHRIGAAAARLRAGGDAPALVLADPMFTSEGILDQTPGFLQGLIDGAHAAGGLFLADEVQAGYGRSGPALWRFALDGVVPDLVTLGKPMGAGYPIGAVLTRRDLAASLGADYEYFSTFAATPVAAAAALAVLDVLDQEQLPQRAVGTGELLRSALRELDDELLGEVRGVGLVAGIDLVGNREQARAVLEGLRDHHVLAGLTGPEGTVLKVRPPLVWEQRHVDHFVGALKRTLTAIRH